MSYADSLRQLREFDARERDREARAAAAVAQRAADQQRRDALWVEDQQRRYAARVAAGEVIQEEDGQ